MRYFKLVQILNVLTCTIAFTSIAITTEQQQVHRLKKSTELWGFFDDLFKRTLGGDLNDDDQDKQQQQQYRRLEEEGAAVSKPNDEMGFSEKDLRKEIERRNEADNLGGQDSNVITSVSSSEEEEREFDGYMLRDAIYSKWGECYDVEFQPVVTFGFRELYLNVMPFRLGGKRFRHKTELDYLCHLQAVVEILEKYDQLDYVLAQLEETNKKPRATSPLVAVPFRLSLTEEELDKILRNM